jgi:hypothetical protein
VAATCSVLYRSAVPRTVISTKMAAMAQRSAMTTLAMTVKRALTDHPCHKLTRFPPAIR